MQFPTITKFLGVPTLTNSMFVTELIMEPDIQEAHDLKEKRKRQSGSSKLTMTCLMDNTRKEEIHFLHTFTPKMIKDIHSIQTVCSLPYCQLILSFSS